MKTQYTTLEVTANICYLAGKGHDFITLFREVDEFENVRMEEGASNSPEDLSMIISLMRDEDRNSLGETAEELLEEQREEESQQWKPLNI